MGQDFKIISGKTLNCPQYHTLLCQGGKPLPSKEVGAVADGVPAALAVSPGWMDTTLSPFRSRLLAEWAQVTLRILLMRVTLDL